MTLVFSLYALFATLFSIGKMSLEYAPPFFIVGLRMTIAGILLLTYQYFVDRSKLKITRKQLWLTITLGFSGIYLTNAMEFWGLQYLTAGKTCLIYSLCPLVSALFSYFYFKEHMTNKKWLGLSIGFAGLMPIFISSSSTESHLRHLLFFSWAELAVAIAAVASVYGWITLRRLVRDGECCFITANAYSMLFGGIMASVNSYLVEGWSFSNLPVTNWTALWIYMALMIIISNVICYNLYGYLLKHYTATLMQFAGFSTPLFTAIFAWFLLGETVSIYFWITLAMIFTGLWIFHKEELRQGYIKKNVKS